MQNLSNWHRVHSVDVGYQYHYCSNFSFTKEKQESCPIAKMTTRCTFVVQYWYRYDPAIKVWSSDINKEAW